MAKKKINYTPYILGVGALAAVGFIFKDDIKKLFVKDEPLPELEPTPVINQNIVTPQGLIPVATSVTKGFNKLGTPKDQLNFDQYYNFGDRGQEVAKMQQILNRIAEITKKPKVTEDGIYGQGTQTRLSQLFTNTSKINLYKMYAALFAIYQTKKDFKSIDKWFADYETILKDPQSYALWKSSYFDDNKLI
jgi:hypothetical protein